MAIGNRMYLPKGAKIWLYRKNAKEPAIWEITGNDFVGQGASSVCYNAVSDGKRGRLKEFYPRITDSYNSKVSYYCQVRQMDYQLVPEEYKKQEISELKKDFLRAYETLDEVKNRSDANSILNNFIPPFEILYGSPNNQGDQSVYVWTPDDKVGKTFDQYLDEVYEQLTKPSDDQLYNILVTILTLTDAVNALHSAKLLHLDIKPSNFMVPYNSEHELNPGSISLFDINTLYRLGGRMPKSTGTEGYAAPELAKGKGENRSDIYSIGAMLYRALMGKGNLYSNAFYGKLAERLASSRLLGAAETNGQPELRDRLTAILQNCLHINPENRYDSSEILIADLKNAIVLLEPAVKRKYLGPYRRFEIVNVELQKQKNPNAIIYNLLYKNPIYRYVPEKEKNIRIMVLGSGEFAQSFIGIALQSCQVVGRDISITVVADDAVNAKKEYEKTRPAVAKFVNINGSLPKGGKETYGTINFTQAHFEAGNRKQNRNEIRRLIKEHKMPHYVFIALGSQSTAEDTLNKEMAQVVADCAKTKAAAMAQDVTVAAVDANFINYVITKEERTELSIQGNPVFVYETITAESIDPRLDRMAFNTHLSWNNTLNLNYSELYDQMRQEKNGYNYISSIAFVLSIPYKLWSIGIPFKSITEAAEAFQQVIDAHAQKPNKNYLKLIQLEHRRWVLEKICDKQGWQAPTNENGEPDYKSCILRGSVKDNQKLTHPCIVRSTKNMPLKEDFYTTNRKENWNKPNNRDNDLDELDRMSIDLHRVFYNKAQQVITSRPLQKGDMPFIEKLVLNETEEVIRAFNRYRYCIRNIINGNQEYTRQFDRIEKDFKNTLNEKASAETKNEILGDGTTGSRLAKIRKMLFPVIESNMYRDYKALDETLVQNIPFILTFKPQADLVLAFEDDRQHNGRNDIIFKNVASATALNPKSITYLYYYDQYTRKDLLLQKLAAVVNYLSKRALHCRINVIIAFANFQDKKWNDDVINQMLAEVRDCIGLVDICGKACGNEQEACTFLTGAFEKTEDMLFDGTTKLFDSNTWNSDFVHKLKSALPYFEFDFRKKHFANCSSLCEYLKYLENGNILSKTYLRIEDMFSLMNAYSTKYNLPEFAEDYETLWKIYTDGASVKASSWRNSVKNWNRLCDTLKECADKQDVLFKIAVDDEKQDLQQYNIPFPSEYIDEAKIFYNMLRSLDIITSGFKLLVDTSDWCEVQIYSQYDLADLFYEISDRPERYLAGRNLTVKKEWDKDKKKDFFVVRYNNLNVNNWQLANNDSYSFGVLQKLERHRFIYNLRMKGGTPVPNKYNNIFAGQEVSFRYASPSIKKLLTTAGEILELYTYYEVLKTGYFDDVACGYEFQWERGDVMNELDCVLTKGFRTFFIECKARTSLEQEFYHKLLSIASQFGIAVTKIMIANTYEQQVEIFNKINKTMEERGSQMEIITIREPENIRNIGETLLKIMENKSFV